MADRVCDDESETSNQTTENASDDDSVRRMSASVIQNEKKVVKISDQSDNRKKGKKPVKKWTKELMDNSDFHSKLDTLVSEAETNNTSSIVSSEADLDAYMLQIITDKLRKNNSQQTTVAGEKRNTTSVETKSFKLLNGRSESVEKKPKDPPLAKQLTEEDKMKLVHEMLQKDNEDLLKNRFQLKGKKEEKQEKGKMKQLKKDQRVMKLMEKILAEEFQKYADDVEEDDNDDDDITESSDTSQKDAIEKTIRSLVKEQVKTEMDRIEEQNKDVKKGDYVSSVNEQTDDFKKEEKKKQEESKKEEEERRKRVKEEVIRDMANKPDSLFVMDNNQAEDGNKSWTKVTSQGLLDVSLLMANASQLRILLATPRDKWEGLFIVLMILLCVSICSQIVLGVLLVLSFHIKGKPSKDEARKNEEDPKKTARKKKEKKHRRRRNRIRMAIMTLAFFLTVTNILITSFGISFIENAKC